MIIYSEHLYVCITSRKKIRSGADVIHTSSNVKDEPVILKG